MATTVHMSEAEVARDLHAVLARVQQGEEIVIEQDHRPVAVIRAQERSSRPIAEILREARLRNSTVTLDDDFGNDLEEVIRGHQEQPWHPPSWDSCWTRVLSSRRSARGSPSLNSSNRF